MRSESFFGFGIRPWVKVGGRDSLLIHSKKRPRRKGANCLENAL